MVPKPQPVGLPAFLTLPKGRGFSRFFVEFEQEARLLARAARLAFFLHLTVAIGFS
jgi:hypothetical protein